MRKLFPGYYPRTKSELHDIWTKGLLVIDANVLLGLYRASKETRESLLSALSARRERLRLPMQAAEEYHKHKLTLWHRKSLAWKMIQDEIAALTKKQHKSFSEYEELGLPDWAKEVQTVTARHAQAFSSGYDDDIVPDTLAESIADLFADGITDLLGIASPEARSRVVKVAEERIKSKVPPGYKDDQKDDPTGDAIIWLELLEVAKHEKLPIIMITDDKKEDWWLSTHGRTLAPRPELLQELHQQAGVDFHMYTT